MNNDEFGEKLDSIGTELFASSHIIKLKNGVDDKLASSIAYNTQFDGLVASLMDAFPEADDRQKIINAYSNYLNIYRNCMIVTNS